MPRNKLPMALPDVDDLLPMSQLEGDEEVKEGKY